MTKTVGSRPQPPMDKALSDHSSYANAACPSDEKVTRLANGLTVTSADTGAMSACVTLFVNAGSRHETKANTGVTHMIERLAFASTSKRTQSQIVADIEALGSNTHAAAAIDSIMFSADGFRGDTAALAALVADNVCAHRFDEAEIAERRELMLIDVEDAYKNYSTMAPEAACEVAFDGKTLGSQALATPADIQALTRKTIVDFAAQHFVGEQMVLAAANVDHGELVRAAEALLGHIPRGSRAVPARAIYTGGFRKRVEPLLGSQPHLGDFSHVTVGVEGVAWGSERLFATAVLQSLLGGGASFSSGGPGKGMYTRLYRRVLHLNYWVNSANAINLSALDAGIFAITGTCEKADTASLLAVLSAEMAIMGDDLNAEEVERAKNMLCSSIAYSLERRFTLAEDLGRQHQLVGSRIAPRDLFARIQAVTATELRDTAHWLLDRGPPTALIVASTEDAFVGLPTERELDAFFRSVRANRAKQ